MTPTSQKTREANLRQSLELLHNSDHVGVILANENTIFEANNAFLRMVGYTREEMERGDINWRAITPPEHKRRDDIAVEQVRNLGACIPLQKEYFRRDGTRLPILLNATRLNLDPLEWVCVIVDLTEQTRVYLAEQQAREMKTRWELVNRLAHEINNPLNALTNLLYLLETDTHPDQETYRHIAQANEALNRITVIVRDVLAVNLADDGSSELPPPGTTS